MIPSVRVVPYRHIASEIAARLAGAREGCDPLSPWPEEVIVPSRGMAEAIARELLARMPAGTAGLRLQSLEELARSLLAGRGDTPHVAGDAERRLAMRVAVRAFDDPLLSTRGIAAMLERSYRDARDSGVTVRAKRGLRNPRRTELLLRAWTEYERVIATMGAIDPAELLTRAARDVSAAKPQLLAGFYDMTGVQRALLQALLDADRVRAVWVPTDLPFAQRFLSSLSSENVGQASACPEARRADKAGESSAPLSVLSSQLSVKPGADPGQLTTENRQQRPPREARPALVAYDTRVEEMRGVCAQVAERLAYGERDLGIVARSLDPYDVRLLNRFAGEYGFRTTLSEETPLAAHRIGRGALTLLRLRERNYPRSEVLGLVRDGLRVQSRIHADDADMATRKARIAGGTSEELRRMRNRSRVIEDYIGLVAELESMTFEVSRFRVESDADVQAAETLEEIVTLVKRTPGAAQADLVDAIENATLRQQPPGSDQQPVVWAGEVLRFRGRSFSHLFAIRMQDDVFPQRRNEDPLLPDADRRLLGMREIGDGRDEEQLLFSLLTQASETVTFSHANGDGFGKVLRPSRFVRGLPGSSDPRGIRRPRAAAAPQHRQLQLLVQAGHRGPFDGYIGPLDPAKLRALSPTQLEDFGECPQKFLLKHILRVEDIDHPERELQIHHRDKGILDHRILEAFYGEFASPLTEDSLARLDVLIDEHFDEHANVAPPFNPTIREIERRATKRILREFVIADVADLEANGLTPRHFEYRFGGKHEHPDHPEPFVLQAAGGTVRVEGTIDRIDAGEASACPGEEPRKATPAYRVVDYKSGKALRHVNLGDKIDRGVRLQLALYAMAVSEFFGVDPEHVTGTIKPIVLGETKPVKFAFALHEKRAAMLETLELFIRAILSGTFPAFPNEDDDFNSCKYCPVNHSCRTRHDLEERYAVQQFGDPRTLLSKGAE